MSDKPISVGDLVMVVRSNSCGCPDRVGFPFIVSVMRPATPLGHCLSCGYLGAMPVGAISVGGHPSGMVCLDRLKRLDPDNLMDDVPTNEELTV